MHGRRRIVLALLTCAVMSSGPMTGLAAVTRHGTWISHTDRVEPLGACYVATAPVAREPRTQRRDPAYFYVAVSQKDGLVGEVSLKLGFPLRFGHEVVVTVDAASFRLFAVGERAYVADRTEEMRLVEAMQRGRRLVVTSTSERGAVTRDTYALTGFPDAMKAVRAVCS